MSNYFEKEKTCQLSFESGGPYWHASTPGKNTPIIFVDDEEMAFAMNVISQAAYEFRAVIRILAFQVMNNHFHFIISGEEDNIRQFFDYVVRRLSRTTGIPKSLPLHLKPVKDLKSMRNNIVYVNRNGFVANPGHTMFSYPWGTSQHYFQTLPSDRLLSDIKSTEARKIFRGRDPKLPKEWGFTQGFVSPASFCAIKFGMSMFQDAHQYSYLISKKVESYSELATDMDDGDFMTDPELFAELLMILKGKYAGAKLSSLSPAQKLDLARILHFDYHSSNGQIRRILGISQYEIDQMF